MTLEAVLELVPIYGAVAIFVLAGLSCLGLPLPGALLLLASGAFVASGDLDLTAVLLAGFAGAVLGDQTGYWLGSLGGAWVQRRLGRGPQGRLRLAQAEAFATRWGAGGVFLSRWLVSPLGPALNLASGILGMNWLRFSAAVLAGEVIWVGGYVALGYAFSGSVVALAGMLGDLAFGLAAGAITLILAMRLVRVVRAGRTQREP